MDLFSNVANSVIMIVIITIIIIMILVIRITNLEPKKDDTNIEGG